MSRHYVAVITQGERLFLLGACSVVLQNPADHTPAQVAAAKRTHAKLQVAASRAPVAVVLREAVGHRLAGEEETPGEQDRAQRAKDWLDQQP